MNIMKSGCKTLAMLALSLALKCTFAHELPDNRVTLVLRDGNHVVVTFFLNYAEVLHKALLPQKSFQEFALATSTFPIDRLRHDLLRIQQKLAADTLFTLRNGKVLPLSNWKWPDAERVQALLREHAMRMVVDPGAHSHDDQLEVTAEIRSVTEITSLTAKLPEQLAPIMVVSYRPSQIWVREKAAAPLISF